MVAQSEPFFDKALASLAGAESEFAAGRYDNCANRAYYACFQAAVVALRRADIRPDGEQWSHEFVPSRFDGLRINRRKRYPAELRSILERNHALRRKADYDDRAISRADAERALRRARLFVTTVLRG